MELRIAAVEQIEAAAEAYLAVANLERDLERARATLRSHEAQMTNRGIPAKLKDDPRTVALPQGQCGAGASQAYVTIGYYAPDQEFTYHVSRPLA